MKLITMNYVDKLSGREFELFTGKLMKLLGFHNVIVTKPTGDYGLDVLATDFAGRVLGIQCKHLGEIGRIGYRAVEEANSGCLYYHADKSIVITNQLFSKRAKNGAKNTGAQLWNRITLNLMASSANNILLKENPKLLLSWYKNNLTKNKPKNNNKNTINNINIKPISYFPNISYSRALSKFIDNEFMKWHLTRITTHDFNKLFEAWCKYTLHRSFNNKHLSINKINRILSNKFRNRYKRTRGKITYKAYNQLVRIINHINYHTQGYMDGLHCHKCARFWERNIK